VRQALRYLLPMLAALAVLAWVVTIVVNVTARTWFARDLAYRAELVAAGTHDRIAAAWRSDDPAAVRRALEELARDERVLGAAACDSRGDRYAASRGPAGASACETLRGGSPELATDASWVGTMALPGGEAHVTALPFADPQGALGHIVIVQDVALVHWRVDTIRSFTVAAFVLVGLLATVATVLISRGAGRRFTDELRRVLRTEALVELLSSPLRGAHRRRELEPILDDVRDLAARLAADSAASGGAGTPWSPERLRQTLVRHLHGEAIVALANREPYIHERAPDGEVHVLHPASGLVTALEPVMRACSGTWVAHGSGGADREFVDRHDRVAVPPGEERYYLRRVWLTREEERGYYYGFSNEGLWPLCHVAHEKPVFRSEDFEHYTAVNRRFATAAAEEARRDDPIVLVQDYHYALAPRFIRQRLPRATILTFWHIPWPNPERLAICPWLPELLEGMLGSSILGFHTQYHCNNFLDAVDHYLEARIDREKQSVVYRGHETLVRPYPISIEWPSTWAARTPPVEQCRREVRERLGLPPDALLGVGVDRLDYTKGIEERLLAVERLLEREPRFRGKFTFAQFAAPSRTAIGAYQLLGARVEAIADRVNRRFGRDGYLPIHLERTHQEPPEVFRYYRAADLCYVSSLHDGMNLVAKEFVAARDDEQGVLVLSRFTGAARELGEALLVNPYDLDEAAGALAAALDMPVPEQMARMRAMRAWLSHFNIYRWAGRMLIDAAALRRRDRFLQRVVDEVRFVEGGG
jgi:trehalose 6-phosphate synthase